jgi:uncharacterized protein (UPF0335 family)
MNMFKNDPDFQAMEEQANEHMADRDAAAQEMSDLLKQAKDNGLNVKAFKRLIAERKRDREEVVEEDRMLEQYRSLLF